ncbi:MAG: hypothetical protein V1912_11370 [bacterium]
MCEHPVADCLTCAWNAVTRALLDPTFDYIWLEGPLREPDGSDFFKATYVGWGLSLGSFKAESATPARALSLLLDALKEHGPRIARWRAQQESSVMPAGVTQ